MNKEGSVDWQKKPMLWPLNRPLFSNIKRAYLHFSLSLKFSVKRKSQSTHENTLSSRLILKCKAAIVKSPFKQTIIDGLYDNTLNKHYLPQSH